MKKITENKKGDSYTVICKRWEEKNILPLLEEQVSPPVFMSLVYSYICNFSKYGSIFGIHEICTCCTLCSAEVFKNLCSNKLKIFSVVIVFILLLVILL